MFACECNTKQESTDAWSCRRIHATGWLDLSTLIKGVCGEGGGGGECELVLSAAIYIFDSPKKPFLFKPHIGAFLGSVLFVWVCTFCLYLLWCGIMFATKS